MGQVIISIDIFSDYNTDKAKNSACCRSLRDHQLLTGVNNSCIGISDEDPAVAVDTRDSKYVESDKYSFDTDSNYSTISNKD